MSDTGSVTIEPRSDMETSSTLAADRQLNKAGRSGPLTNFHE
jgi:hypothetical protein